MEFQSEKALSSNEKKGNGQQWSEVFLSCSDLENPGSLASSELLAPLPTLTKLSSLTETPKARGDLLSRVTIKSQMPSYIIIIFPTRLTHKKEPFS